MAGEQRSGPVGTWAARLAPLVVIALLQLVVISRSGPSAVKTQAAGPGEEALAAGEQQAAETVASGGSAVGGAGETSAGAQPAAGGATSQAKRAGGGTAAVASTGSRAAAASIDTVPQKVDALGRPLEGDLSKCAPGGALQEKVSFSSPRCVPKFTGDNSGATYQGVTADTITVVVLWPQYQQGVQQALAANGLAATPEEAKQASATWAAFINKHYELYGRKLKVVDHFMSESTSDPAAMRAVAKELVAKYHPFVVNFYAPGIMPEPMIDQLAQMGVMSQGAGPLSDSWFKAHAPFAWGKEPHGFRVAEMVADYYCKKMQGKNATLAGDPTMRVKRRKLGIATFEDPGQIQVGERMKALVSGEMCGSPADDTKLYVLSADSAQAAQQAPTFIAKMKDDGITTVTSPSFGLPGTQFNDSQQFYPENLTAGVGNVDDDLVGQFFSQTLSSPTQMSNTFGIGFYPKASPPSEREFYAAAHDIDPKYDPPYLTQGPWDGLSFLAHLFQWAGPKLTPQTVAEGARTSEQINGWVNPNAWPGWKCCNPYAPEWKLSGPNNWTAWADAREIYWSQSDISPSNNKPGTWKCVNDCRRYEVGLWPKGEPKQAS